MVDFLYAAPAEVFACRKRGSGRAPIVYRRFQSGAEALQYAIEVLPADLLFGACIEIGESRYDAAEIRRLYDSPLYPLARSRP